ncbi:outer membrane protein assembly factor BamD [Portibacter marinus]|uniref:outer membrane protein assembly factor BamD n=1 Tax=Portibacter marinus TaxID=2898660 RepID=UPI001F207F54|nr:outer membrane protein assembly factor BamD [Portibacter marinus]
MSKSVHFLFTILLCILAFTSCKTEFEKIRTSNDPPVILKEANKLYKQGQYLKAQSLYDIIIPFYRGRQEADDIFYNYAQTHYELGDYILAAHYFDSYAKTFGNSPRREEASFMAAYSNYLLSPSFRLDQTYTEKAIAELQLFVNNFPMSEKVGESNEMIEELRAKLEIKAFEQGKLYFRIREYQSAITSFKNVLLDYPDTDNYQEIYYYIIKSAYLLAANSVYDKKKERFEETLKYYNQFKKRYPKSKYLKELRSDIENANEQIKSLSV